MEKEELRTPGTLPPSLRREVHRALVKLQVTSSHDSHCNGSPPKRARPLHPLTTGFHLCDNRKCSVSAVGIAVVSQVESSAIFGRVMVRRIMNRSNF